MKSTKSIIIWSIAVLLLVITTSIVLARSFGNKPQYEFLEIRRGAVTKSIAVSGSVVSNQKLELSFLSPGVVKTVGVEVGDEVEAGDVLVALDDSLLRAQAAQASAGLASARAMLAKAENSLRDADRNVLNQSLSNARQALDIARSNLQDAYRTRDNDINNSQRALSNAEATYRDALNIYNSSLGSFNQGIEIARVALNNATSALSSAQTNYNYILSLYNSGQVTYAELQQAQMALNSANFAYNNARANYNAAVQQTEAQRASALASLHAAEMQLSSARAAYDNTISGADMKLHSAENAASSAEAAYNLASAQYNQSMAPAHSADIASVMAQVNSSSASLRAIQVQIERMKIKAPIAGTVTAIDSKVGELSGMSGPAVVLETVGDYSIEANIAETDINQVQMGLSVLINFDGLPNVNVRGVVAKVNPAATVILGVINYKIMIVLEEFVEDLKPAMTADLEILTDSREGVLFVPRSALARSEGMYTAKILIDEKPVDKTVEVGLIGDTEIEIISGLSEGDRIISKELK
ncbi:HlyD family efflux transporter periplasmic adaptor subunit [Patescibacteria group bacterium]|nr:HlyD family efflux transporter periplasmic adaptor subunit [Patescibacteria group bacterium]